MKRKFLCSILLLVSASILTGCAGTGATSLVSPKAPQEFTQENFQGRVNAALRESDLVGLGAVVADAEGNILALAVSGERVSGSNDPIQAEDAWHMGSNTQMLTTLLYARLVEDGHAKWGATLSELLPDLADEMDPSWQDVTVEELMSHRAGLPRQLLALRLGPLVYIKIYEGSPHMQRTLTVERALAKPSEGERGEFAFSDAGYVVLGAAIDRIAAAMPGAGDDASYETLFADILFENTSELAKIGWGLGASVGIEGHLVPWIFGPVPQGTYGSGGAPISMFGPVKTAYAPLASHAIFLSQFLTPDPFHSKLLGPYPDESPNYSYGLGWRSDNHDKFGLTYGQGGVSGGPGVSNGSWWSNVALFPELGVVIIANANQGNRSAISAINDLVETIAGDIAQQQNTDQASGDTVGRLVERQNPGYTFNEL